MNNFSRLPHRSTPGREDLRTLLDEAIRERNNASKSAMLLLRELESVTEDLKAALMSKKSCSEADAEFCIRRTRELIRKVVRGR